MPSSNQEAHRRSSAFSIAAENSTLYLPTPIIQYSISITYPLPLQLHAPLGDHIMSNTFRRFATCYPQKLMDSNNILVSFIFLIALLIQAQYITYQIHRIPPFQPVQSNATIYGLQAPNTTIIRQLVSTPNTSSAAPAVPKLFIFRRTKKTGSSAMLAAILSQLLPLGYLPLYKNTFQMDAMVRSEFVSHSPRKLLVVEHNHITKDFHPTRDAIIADTIRDGYKQMTSYCRYVKKVRECSGPEMVSCLESAEAIAQNRYRWATREEEDEDTYIDLPLSSEHPSLSTTVFRRAFPNATLQVQLFNVARSACPENASIREVYNRNYAELESQIEKLRRRMLVLGGYPYAQKKDLRQSVSLVEMMREAEKIEKQKYSISAAHPSSTTYSADHQNLIYSLVQWTRNAKGKLALKKTRP